jgi:enoyl-CoA hydratase
MEMILTGDAIDAQEALRIGLVNAVVPQADLIKTAEAMAQKIIGKGQVAVKLALKAVNASDELPLSAGLNAEAECFGRCCSSEDFKEGTTAFLEKRKAVFKNK